MPTGTAGLRPATIADVPACARIIYTAFSAAAEEHGFPSDYDSLEGALVLARGMIAAPNVFGVVAESDGAVVGANFLVESDEIRGVGPTCVDPRFHRRGVGRSLMEAVLERARGAAGVRLVADAFNLSSTALYASLGFEVKEPLLLMRGSPAGAPATPQPGVRRMRAADVEGAAALGERVLGTSRREELALAVEVFEPYVLERAGRLRAYLTSPGYWPANHAAAESAEDLQALLVAAARASETPLAFLLPVRQGALFRWALEHGLRAVKPLLLMSKGAYREAEGAYLPSVYY